jgi:predicted KAP-like P-loop ATPase
MLLFERCGKKEAYEELIARVNDDPTGKPTFLAEWEEKAISGKELELEGHWDDEFLKDWLALRPKLGDMDLRGLLYVSREHAPIVTAQDRLSSEAAELLTALVEHPEMASALHERLTTLPRPELSVIAGRIMDHARTVQEWGVPPILDACIELSKVDSSFAQHFAAFLSERPASQVTAPVVAKIAPESWSDSVFKAWNRGNMKEPVKRAIKKVPE